MLFEDIAEVKGDRAIVKDSKTRDTTTTQIDVNGYSVTVAIDQSRFGTIYRIWSISGVPTVKIDTNSGWTSLDRLKKEVLILVEKWGERKGGRKWNLEGDSLSYVKREIDSPTADSLYKGQKVTAIKSEEGLREGETYTVIRGEKPIAQSSEAEIKTVYVLQDSSANLVTVSGGEDLFYKTEDANSIYSVRKNLRTGAIEYDKGGNWLPIEGKIKEAFENEQYIFSRTDKEGYAHYSVQVMDSADTFTKGEALKVKIGEIQKNMDAVRKMGYDTATYQKEIDKLQESSKIKDAQGFGTRIETYKGFTIYKSAGERYTNFIAVDKNENEAIWANTIQELKRLVDEEDKMIVGN